MPTRLIVWMGAPYSKVYLTMSEVCNILGDSISGSGIRGYNSRPLKRA